MTGDSPTNCAACGYDLSGLGQHGQCPECGQDFDRVTGEGLSSRTGEASERYRRGDRLVRRLRTILLAALTITIMACGGAAVLFVDNWHYAVSAAAVIAGVFALATATSLLSEKDES